MPMSRTEKLSHYAVVLIAVSAVVVSVWQVRLSQKHNRLSVRPYLDFFSGWTAEREWEMTLSNEGVGPAILKKQEYSFGGKTYGTWDEVLKAANIFEQRINSTTFSPNSPFAADKTIVFLKLDRTEAELSKPIGISVKISYESVYEEPFELKINF